MIGRSGLTDAEPTPPATIGGPTRAFKTYVSCRLVPPPQPDATVPFLRRRIQARPRDFGRDPCQPGGLHKLCSGCALKSTILCLVLVPPLLFFVTGSADLTWASFVEFCRIFDSINTSNKLSIPDSFSALHRKSRLPLLRKTPQKRYHHHGRRTPNEEEVPRCRLRK